MDGPLFARPIIRTIVHSRMLVKVMIYRVLALLKV